MSRTVPEAWAEISPYLDAVLELDSDKRDAWLADLQIRRPLMARSVRAHLAELAELDARNFMNVAIPARVYETHLAGRRFGAYTLECAIGHGGMGTVWLARRSDGQFEGRAAVKLLNTALIGNPSELRLAREVRVLAKLQHPNIAHLIDAGVEADKPYLILEHVSGLPIDQYCAARNLGIHRRIRLFLDVLRAVAHAHGHLVVHRDLKPSNILVTDDGTVKLLDFGVAALLSPHGQSIDPAQQLPPGLTPGYAAPEQLLGEPITIATDVHALGALLFVLLSGQHPSLCHGKTRAEWMRAVLEREAPRMSDYAASAGDRRVLRGDLDHIVAMALRRTPGERYGTVDHFAQDLRRYLAFEPVSARPRTFAYLARMFARRHRAAVAAAMIVAAVVVLAMGLTTQQMLEARYQRDQARFQSDRAEASIDFLTQLMRSNSGAGASPQTFHERLALGVGILKRQYQDDPKFAGRMLVDLADYYRNDGETARANELYAQAYELGRKNDDKELMVSAQCSRADGDAYAGIHEGTEARVEEAQRLLAQIPKSDVALHIGCLLAQVTFKERTGDLTAAESILERAMKTREEVDGTTETVAYATLLTERGAMHYLRGQPREALITTRKAADIYERSGRGRMPAGLSARFAISTFLADMGELRLALAERDIIQQRLRETGESKAEHVAYPVTHGLLLLRMGRVSAAQEMLDGVVERAREAGNPHWLAWALLSIGQLSIEQGRLDAAEVALNEAAILLDTGASDVNTRIFSAAYLAELALARNDIELARRHRDLFLQLADYGGKQPSRALSRVLNIAARVALAEGAAGDAERFARDGLGLAQKKSRDPDTSADVGEALLRISEARLLADAGADVRSLLEQADRCLTAALGADHPLTIEVRNRTKGRREASPGSSMIPAISTGQGAMP